MSDSEADTLLLGKHWQSHQVCRFYYCCAADSQANEDKYQLDNNLKIAKFEDFASAVTAYWGHIYFQELAAFQPYV